jgi:hypothetical protein
MANNMCTPRGATHLWLLHPDHRIPANLGRPTKWENTEDITTRPGLREVHSWRGLGSYFELGFCVWRSMSADFSHELQPFILPSPHGQSILWN